MPFVTALIGAFVLTFLVSRAGNTLIPRIFPKLSGRMVLLLSHFASFVILGLLSAMLKANQEALRESAMAIYALPQIVWLLLDFHVYTGQTRRR